MLKSRKKMLVSSIAMLLVALVALGSATFAWYYNQNTVTASTTTFQASAADGLVIRHQKGQTWTDKIQDLATKETGMTPATIDYSKTWSTMTGEYGAKSSGPAVSTYETAGTAVDNAATDATKHLDAANNAYLIDHFYVATPAAAKKTNCTVTVKGTANANTYLSVAVFVDNVLIGVVNSSGATTTTNRMATGTPTYSLQALNNAFGAFDINSNVNNGDGSEVYVVAFVDGENPKCTTVDANVTPMNFTYEFACS